MHEQRGPQDSQSPGITSRVAWTYYAHGMRMLDTSGLYLTNGGQAFNPRLARFMQPQPSSHGYTYTAEQLAGGGWHTMWDAFWHPSHYGVAGQATQPTWIDVTSKASLAVGVVALGGAGLIVAGPSLLAAANGAIINSVLFASSSAGTATGGVVAAGTVAGMMLSDDVRDAVISSSDPAHLSGLFAEAGEFIPVAVRGARNAGRSIEGVATWLAEADPLGQMLMPGMRSVSVPRTAAAAEEATGSARFGWLRASERPTAVRFEAQEGIQLSENPVNGGADSLWRLDSRTTAHVDFMGVPKAYEPQNWPGNFINQIERHATNHDFTVIDLTRANETQIYQILEKVYSLPTVKQGGVVLTGW